MAKKKRVKKIDVSKLKPGALKRVLTALGKTAKPKSSDHDSHVMFGSHESHGSHGQHTSHASSIK